MDGWGLWSGDMDIGWVGRSLQDGNGPAKRGKKG